MDIVITIYKWGLVSFYYCILPGYLFILIEMQHCPQILFLPSILFYRVLSIEKRPFHLEFEIVVIFLRLIINSFETFQEGGQHVCIMHDTYFLIFFNIILLDNCQEVIGPIVNEVDKETVNSSPVIVTREPTRANQSSGGMESKLL